ncbi:MAG: sigma-70 family RNA polymerase sigma factor [Pseudonocardiales bacterium]
MSGDVVEDEGVLLARLRGGDEASFAKVVAAWSPAMLRLAQRFVGTREQAEDTVQSTWLAVVQGLDRFAGQSSLRTWVMSILIHQAQHTHRRERRSVPFCAAWQEERGASVDPRRFRADNAAEYPGGWASPLPRWDRLPENHVLAAELWDTLDRAISGLPRRQQQVVTARDVWGCNAKEVCAMLHVSANYQRVLLHRARSQLRLALESYLQAEPE